MPVNISDPFSGASGDWVIPFLLLYLLLWLFALGVALTRADFDPITRLTWVVVIIFVPVFGMVLYFALTLRGRVIDPTDSLAGTPWENDPGHRISKNR